MACVAIAATAETLRGPRPRPSYPVALAAAGRVADGRDRILRELRKVIVGQDEVVGRRLGQPRGDDLQAGEALGGLLDGVPRVLHTVGRHWAGGKIWVLDEEGPPVYVRGEIVHNQHVVRTLADRGAVVVGSRILHSAFYAPMLSDWCNFETWRLAGAQDAAQRGIKEAQVRFVCDDAVQEEPVDAPLTTTACVADDNR